MLEWWQEAAADLWITACRKRDGGGGGGEVWHGKDVESMAWICAKNLWDYRTSPKWKLRCPKPSIANKCIVLLGQNLNISLKISTEQVSEAVFRIFLPPACHCSSEACWGVLEDEEEERKMRRGGITEGPTGRDTESWGWCPPVGMKEERERERWGIRKRRRGELKPLFKASFPINHLFLITGFRRKESWIIPCIIV